MAENLKQLFFYTKDRKKSYKKSSNDSVGKNILMREELLFAESHTYHSRREISFYQSVKKNLNN